MRMMDDATRPVKEREAMEAAERRRIEQARLAREAAERAKELAERQAREQALAKIYQEKALKLANRAAELKLHELMKERGPEALRQPQTIEQLGRTMEQTFTKEKIKLSELGHTKESLREGIKNYVEGVARDPDSFTRRMEPEREQEKERSRSIEHDRGYGYSR
jgi:hypothetical protein